MKPTQSASPELLSAQVLARFALRLAIVGVFAAFGPQGFGKTAQALFELAAVYCVLIGAVRREAPFGPALTNYDEAAAYGLAASLARLAS